MAAAQKPINIVFTNEPPFLKGRERQRKGFSKPCAASNTPGTPRLPSTFFSPFQKWGGEDGSSDFHEASFPKIQHRRRLAVLPFLEQ